MFWQEIARHLLTLPGNRPPFNVADPAIHKFLLSDEPFSPRFFQSPPLTHIITGTGNSTVPVQWSYAPRLQLMSRTATYTSRQLWLRCLVAGLSPQTPWLDPRTVRDGICGGQIGTGASCSPGALLVSCQYHSTNAPYPYRRHIVHPGCKYVSKTQEPHQNHRRQKGEKMEVLHCQLSPVTP
jgi:hypothetical protein